MLLKKLLTLLLAIIMSFGAVASAVGDAIKTNSVELDIDSINFFGGASRLLSDDESEGESYISSIALKLDSDIMLVNGEEITVSSPYKSDGSEYLPIADIAEAIGAAVDVDYATGEITIEDDGEVTVLDTPSNVEDFQLHEIQEIADVLTLDYAVEGEDIILTRPFQSKMLLVRMRPGKNLADTFGASDYITDGNGRYVLKFDSVCRAKEAFSAIGALPNCLDISPNRIVFAFDTPTVTEFEPLALPEINWGAERINVELMKDYLEKSGGTSEDIIVAVLDSGAYTAHEHLAGRLVPGYNFSTSNPDDPDYIYDAAGHGTHIAGNIVTCTPENVKIMPVKVLNNNGVGYQASVAEAIVWVANNENKPKVINMSIGMTNTGSDPNWDNDVRIACEYAKEKGVTIVAAAGNGQPIGNPIDTKYVSPARLACVITIVATDQNDKIASFSNFGDSVDFSAPGVDILSSWLNNRYYSMNGTSQAASFVTASVAMLTLDDPNLGPDDIKETLKSMAVDLGDVGWDKIYGWGLIDFRLFIIPCITGKVKSYNPQNSTCIQLMQGGIEVKKTRINEKTESGQIKQPFIIKGVAPGNYTLIVSKPGHTSYSIENVAIGIDEYLDLTLDERPEVNLMTLRCGDINSDGYINDGDLTILWMAENYNKNVENAANKLCDLNGDGYINDGDLTILWMAYNYNKGEIIIK